jgi:hypothetical protein
MIVECLNVLNFKLVSSAILLFGTLVKPKEIAASHISLTIPVIELVILFYIRKSNDLMKI